MDIIELINSVIVDLDKITVKGAENMALLLGSIRKLDAVRQALSEVNEKARSENVPDNH